jgi:hypothetical protein
MNQYISCADIEPYNVPLSDSSGSNDRSDTYTISCCSYFLDSIPAIPEVISFQ